MKPHHRRCYMPSAPLLGRPGPLPRACTLVSSWVQEGSVEGDPRRQSCRTRCPDEICTRDTAVGPGCRSDQPRRECRGPRGRLSRWISHRPSRPTSAGARAAAGLRPLPGPFLLNTAPSFTKARSTTRAPDPPVYFGHFSPWTLLLYYFMSNKAFSEA